MTNLPKVLADPDNITLRTAMSRGALLAGIALPKQEQQPVILSVILLQCNMV